MLSIMHPYFTAYEMPHGIEILPAWFIILFVGENILIYYENSFFSFPFLFSFTFPPFLGWKLMDVAMYIYIT